MDSAELLMNFRHLAKSENQRQLLDALEKSALRYNFCPKCLCQVIAKARGQEVFLPLAWKQTCHWPAGIGASIPYSQELLNLKFLNPLKYYFFGIKADSEFCPRIDSTSGYKRT